MTTGSAAIDTNAYSDLRGSDRKLRQMLNQLHTVYLPVTVLGEILYAAENSGRREVNLRLVQEFLGECQVAIIDEAVAARYASLRRELRRLGRPIPENDNWIAAICLDLGVPLLTRDAHFDHVPGLQVVRW